MAIIRRMELEDLPDVAVLESRSFTVPWSAQLLEQAYYSRIDRTWVLEEQGRIMGYCNFRVIAGEGELMRIAVLPEARGRGYGRELLEFLAETARAEQLAAITLEVRASNLAAISLYKYYGFENQAVRKRYYTNPIEDAMLMIRRFG